MSNLLKYKIQLAWRILRTLFKPTFTKERAEVLNSQITFTDKDLLVVSKTVGTLLNYHDGQHAKIFTQNFQNLPPPMDREALILQHCQGRRVLHFGFLDAPFLKEKLDSNNLLHIKIKEQASFIYGCDIHAESLSAYRSATNDEQNCLLDVQKPERLVSPELANNFDLIVFSEILEHLTNPGIALDNLKQIAYKNVGCQLLITVPNAFSTIAFTAALRGVEIVHPEHFTYFSPYTLSQIVIQAGFTVLELGTCGGISTPELSGITQPGVYCVCQLSSDN